MSKKSALGERVMFPSPYLDKFIAIHQTHSHVPRERSPAAGTAMTAHGDNDTSAQPQITQWGRLGEILGGVQFSWSSAARCRLVTSLSGGVEDKYGPT